MAITDIDSEKVLFQQIAEGNQHAFRQIFDLYRKGLFSTAIKITKSQLSSEEIVQEVFISLWVSREQLVKVDSPGSYLFKILFNKISTYLKKDANRERIVKNAMRYYESSVNAIEEVVDANESKRRINEVVEKLPPQQKAVYKLSRIEGLKIDEIATQLKISPHTVKSHLSKALEAIRSHFNDIAFVIALLETFNSHKHL